MQLQASNLYGEPEHHSIIIINKFSFDDQLVKINAIEVDLVK